MLQRVITTSQDTIFENMTFEQWTAALRPKVAATWNLHRQLPELDFFVMLSSLSGVGGSTSQANYSAGNTFQDLFAKWRYSQGLPAVSIDLGYVMGAGYVAETDGVGERLIKIGFKPIEEAQTLRIIESAMRNPRRSLDLSQCITGICSFDETMKVAWRHDRRFWPLQTNKASLSDDTTRGKESGANSLHSLKDAIATSDSYDAAVAVVTEALVHMVFEMFTIPIEEIDTSQPIQRYGVDSLVAVEVRNWLTVAVRADVSIFDVTQSPSLIALARKVAEKSKYVIDKGLKVGGN
jgi:KR domain/Phosphopantetheine attachment site